MVVLAQLTVGLLLIAAAPATQPAPAAAAAAAVDRSTPQAAMRAMADALARGDEAAFAQGMGSAATMMASSPARSPGRW